MRIAMLVSVAFNLLLLATIVTARVDQTYAVVDDDTEPFAGGLAADRPVPRPVATVEVLEGVLGAAGLDSELVKAMSLAWLERRHRVREGAAVPGYWQPDFAPAAAALSERIAVGEAVRGALIERYGPAAIDDPAFAVAFRPLGPAFDFLSSSEQLALERRELERSRAAEPASPRAAGGDAACLRVLRPAAASAAPAASAELAKLLRGAAYEEYLLRFSPLAARLRAAEIAADEITFRRIFALLRELEQRPSPSEQLRLRSEIRGEMGDSGFDRFFSLHDPMFAPLAGYLERQGFAEAAIHAAHSIVSRTQESLLELASRGSDQARMVEAANRLKQQETSRLTALLGEKAAAGLGAAMTQAAVRLATGAGPSC